MIRKIPVFAGNVVLWASTLFFLWPMYWMLVGSFKQLKVALQIPPEWFPKQPTLENFSILVFDFPLLRWLYNSMFISVAATLLVVVVSALAAYAFAKVPFKGSKWLFAAMIASMSIPHTVLLIPLFQMMNKLGLTNTLWGVLLPLVGWPFGVFLLKQFMSTLPGALIEAAKIDGCNQWQTFSRVMLPLAKPGLAVLGIFTFVNSWNDYVWQVVMLKDKMMYTLPVGVKIARQVQEVDINYGVAMAGALCATLPVLLVFLFFQRFFTQGITFGALKG
ncbi:carbohydrate ABC transporter permease [Paenibacillus ginsengarvi]|uniref:Carbohydrate ABC transporter permease n=1 Tax=Paenibacillus ginsengarvi TaxID=400777 RepID=A0A3B0BD50_9BACL|nr:carbohydrate ABC transporter permease [Paenibacillus ginsengarvi]RKN70612.1 carbohydrate ABC transporter permease [Paenibacillus ginsengarvi]